jgi:hypothetical protein
MHTGHQDIGKLEDDSRSSISQGVFLSSRIERLGEK